MASILWNRWLNIVPLSLIVIGFLALVCGMTQLVTAQAPVGFGNPPAPQTPATPDPAILAQQISKLASQLDEMTKSRDELNNRLNSVSQQVSHAQWLLSIVLGAAGLLTLLQGFFAFFSAQNYVKAAEEAIKRANDAGKEAKSAAESIATEIRARFPMFYDAESARSDAFNELSKLTVELENGGYENLYKTLEPLKRQRLYAIESFSALEFLASVDRKELIRNLRLLGRFYATKFLTEAPSSLKSDSERALYYFELAAQKSTRSYSAVNDLGWLYSLVFEKPDIARRLFEESLRSKADQQRAIYCLGTLSLKRGDKTKLTEGMQYLLKAKKLSNWEETPIPSKVAHIDYNLACFLDGLAALEPDSTKKNHLLDDCAAFLALAAPEGQQSKKLLDDDLTKPDGDLLTLGGSQMDEHKQRLQDIRAAYEIAWQKRGTD